MSDQACGEAFQELKAGIRKAGSPAGASLPARKILTRPTMVPQ